MSFVVEETEYHLAVFLYLAVILGIIVFLSVRHIRKSKRLFEARTARNEQRRNGRSEE